MKSIQQIADELNVSKTAIRKHIRKLGIENSLQKIGNRFMIDENQENQIKSSFVESETQTGSRTETETVHEQSTTDWRMVCDILQKQLDEKDSTINNLMRLLDQEQQLHAKTRQALDIKEQKLLELESKPEEAAITIDEQPKKWWNVFRR